MPAPTNIDAASATDLTGLLPYSLSQNVHDAGVTYTVWYKITPDYTGTMGVWGFGALAGYTPLTSIFDNAGADIYAGIFNYGQRPIQIPVVDGHEIWFRFATNSGTFSPAVLTGLIQKFDSSGVPLGSIFINDASSATYLAALLSSTTGAPLDYVQDFPGGEGMAQLDSGILLVEDTDDANLKVYSPAYAEVATVAITESVALSSDRAALFYVGHTASSSTPGLVQTVDPVGAIGATTWDVGPGMSSLAPSRDNTILYYAAGTAAAAVQRWDLALNIAMSNLAAGVADHTIRELFVLADDTVLALYRDTSPTSTCFVRHYSAAGATLLDYTSQFTDSTGSDPHLAMAVDDPTSFWAWFKIADFKSRFINIAVSDGTINTTAEGWHFSSGLLDATASATPPAYFGHSESCTFVITMLGTAPVSFTTTEVIPRRLRRTPHLSNEQLWTFYHQLQVDLQAGVGTTTGQGVTPQVMLRWSRDGGRTWSSEQWTSAGALGAYKTRALWRRLGRARDMVFEVVVSDPVPWMLAAGYIQVERGTS
jgi:hypothetical protein